MKNVYFPNSASLAATTATPRPEGDLLLIGRAPRADYAFGYVLVDSGARPHLAVPHGDMMLTGNFGLLRAYAAHDPRVREAVQHRLGPG